MISFIDDGIPYYCLIIVGIMSLIVGHFTDDWLLREKRMFTGIEIILMAAVFFIMDLMVSIFFPSVVNGLV